MFATYIFLLFCASVINGSKEIFDVPVATTLYGKISGRTFTSGGGKTIYAFQEVPYATPPVGKLRFKESIPPKQWEGVVNTTSNTKICMETKIPEGGEQDPRQNEDCLYLNVYTTQLPSSNGNNSLHPVMAYVYGGNFSFGDATFQTYDPQLLVESGVVSVIFNYRSASLGFLSTNDGVIPANLGLKDQTLALKWIQGNIKFFGGDASKVTLVGHSSGGYCVNLHLASRRSAGLFQSAVLLSTTAIDIKFATNRARTAAFKLGKVFSPHLRNGPNRTSSEKLLRVLRKVPVDILAGTAFIPKNVNPWSPLLEADDDPNAFISELMFKEYVNGAINAHSLMIGLTSEEILRFQKQVSFDQIASQYDKNVTFMLDEYYDDKQELKFQLAKELKQIYTDEKFEKDILSLIKYQSDSVFSMKIIGWADLMRRYRDIYFYQFSYYGELNKAHSANHDIFPGIGKVGHVEDLSYLYYSSSHNKVSDDPKFPPKDILTRRRLIKLWTNFMKYENPTPETDDLLQNVTWAKLSRDEFRFLDIDADLTLRDGYPRSYARWKEVLGNYYQNPVTAVIRIPV